MKVAWLAPYPLGNLKQVVFSRPVVKYGTGTWLKNLAEELIRKENIDLHIICEAGNIKESQFFVEDDIKYHLIKNTVPFLNKGFPYYLPIQELSYYLPNYLRIKKVIDTIIPDIVHAHGTENSYALSALRSGYPAIISIQGVFKEIMKFNKPGFRNSLKTLLEARSIRKGHHFICRTNLDTSFVKSLNSDARIHIIHEAMNPIFFDKNWVPKIENSILYVGSLSERKGIMVLLKAIIQLKIKLNNIRAFLIGTGNADYIKELKSFCIYYNIIDNVYFLGYQNADTISEYHLKSQILVCPSFIENSPNCVAEAMVTGLPVIASNVGGIPSMITDGETGYLVDPNNVNAFADKIYFLLSDLSARGKISKNSRVIARERHWPKNVADKTMNIYRKVLYKSAE